MTDPASCIDPRATPSGTGCLECETGDGPGWWLHLRRCAQCGQVGCCDSSPSQHASHHARSSGHRVMRSFEPGEDWFWDFGAQSYVDGPALAPPDSRPASQPVPGPEGRVPSDWKRQLH